MTDVGEHYRRSRERLTGLLGEVDEGSWAVPVAACPGWCVHDVVGHLVGIIEDAMAGELSGATPPDAIRTAAQVERHRDQGHGALLEQWAELAGPFEEILTDRAVWPAALDVGSHEQDVRIALSRPGARDDELILDGAHRLIQNLDVEATIEFDLGDETISTTPKPGPTYRLRTTPFEVFRFRLGRRSRNQVAGLDWSPAPDDIVDRLFVFGPAEAPLIE